MSLKTDYSEIFNFFLKNINISLGYYKVFLYYNYLRLKTLALSTIYMRPIVFSDP